MNNNTGTLKEILEQIKRHQVTKQPGKVAFIECPRAEASPGAPPCEVIGKGKPERRARLPGGGVESVWVQQLKCKRHGMFRVLPTVLVERKHYVAPIIEEALETRVTGEPVESFCSRRRLPDPSTPYRWIRAFRHRLQEIGDRCQQWLATLSSDRGSSPHKASWTLPEVWNHLSWLQDIFRDLQRPVPSRAYFALAVRFPFPLCMCG